MYHYFKKVPKDCLQWSMTLTKSHDTAQSSRLSLQSLCIWSTYDQIIKPLLNYCLRKIVLKTPENWKGSFSSSSGRAGLSILGALEKFNSSGPPKAIHAKPIVHYMTIHKQHMKTQPCMHAHTILTLFVKSTAVYR